MNRGNVNLISTEEVIALAKARLGIDNTDNDIWFNIELDNLMRKYKSSVSIDKRVCSVMVKDRSFRLPSGIIKIIGMAREPDGTEEDIADRTFPWVVIANTYRGSFDGCGCFEDYWHVGEDGFGKARNGNVADGDYRLAFYGYNVDSNGVMKIYEDYQSFAANYLCYMFLQNPRNQKMYENPYIAKDTRKDFYNSYLAEKKGMKALENRYAFKEGKSALDWSLSRVYIGNLNTLFTF